MRRATLIEHPAEHELWFLVVGVALTLTLLSSFAEASAQARTAPHAFSVEQITSAEQRLAALGYWAGPVDGKFDNISQQALIAFQKVEGRKRTGHLNAAELEALSAACPPEPRDKTYAHIEIDLRRQVLTAIDESGATTHILSVSTGNEGTYTDHGQSHRARTPRGRFIVHRKILGWRRSSLGLLYYPNYIVNGIAIHGAPSVPPFPASHGCIRIPMFAAKHVSEHTPLGTIVVVFDN